MGDRDRESSGDMTERKRLEFLLQESNEKYRIIADFAYDWEYWLGPDKRFLYVSPSAERITGYSPSEFVDNPDLLVQIIHPDDRHLMVRHLAECEEKSSNTCRGLEFRVISKPGTTVWIEHNCQAVFMSDGSYAGQRACNRVITRRKLAEDKLQESENQLRAILEATTETIFLMAPDGKLLTANHLTAERLHTDMETLKKGDIFDFLPPETAESRRKMIRQVVETGSPVQFEDERFGRAILNSIFPILDKERNVAFLAVFGRDITEEKRMDELLREREERYRSLFQNSHAPMLLIDPHNGRIVDANPAACRYYGHDIVSLKALNIADINTLKQDRIFEEMARARAEQRDHFHFSHRLANGEIRPVEVYSGPVVVNGKNLLYSIVHDIGERKKVEAEKERLILELRDALSKIKQLSGMFPICASCKKIRDDKGYWTQIEAYITEHSEAEFSHGICPECMEKLYPEFQE